MNTDKHIYIYLSLPWHQICLTWTHLPILGVGVASCHFTWWPSGYLTVNFTAKAGKDPQVDIVAMQHLLDACCSSPCHGLLKRPDQCPPQQAPKPQPGCSAVQSCSASRHAAQQEKEWRKPLRGATASCAKSWCIRHQALHSPCWMLINAASYWGLCHRPCPCARGSDSANV